MSLLRPGSKPVLPRSALPALAVLAVTLAAAGCSSRPDGTTSFIWSNEPYHVAAAQPRPEMEDDGREGQLPPPMSRRREPDDPSEPYSPNYGSKPAAARAPVATAPLADTSRAASAATTAAPAATWSADAAASPDATRLPDDLPPAFRRRLASALGDE